MTSEASRNSCGQVADKEKTTKEAGIVQISGVIGMPSLKAQCTRTYKGIQLFLPPEAGAEQTSMQRGRAVCKMGRLAMNGGVCK